MIFREGRDDPVEDDFVRPAAPPGPTGRPALPCLATERTTDLMSLRFTDGVPIDFCMVRNATPFSLSQPPAAQELRARTAGVEAEFTSLP